jgi:hypothetical protein
MKLNATGGTDGANIVLYWPDHLPNDADARLKDDPVEQIEQLERDGKLIVFPCDGDGAYSLAVFVREEPPAELMRYCREAKTYRSVLVHGDGYFGGAEYVCKCDCAFRTKYPHMSTKIAIPDGAYGATVYAVEPPEELESQWLRERAGRAGAAVSNVVGVLVVGVVVCAFASLIGLAFMTWTVWFCVAGAGIVLAALAWALSRTAGYRAVADARAEFERAYPAYVLSLA